MGCIALLLIAVAALAQEARVAPGAPPGMTVPAGVSLRVALERRVAIKRVGEPIQGRLVDPIYVYDRGWSCPPEPSRLKSRLSEMLPYHRQAWQPFPLIPVHHQS